jgi:hypothetical protein
VLTYKLLKNHAGVLLTGDYETLRALHEIVHAVNERSPLLQEKEGPFLGLAYDLRKAYEGQRQKLRAPEGYPEIGPRFGVEILWPVLLWQSRMLRASMAFIPTNRQMHAQTYALEAVIEAALVDDFGAEVGNSVIGHWERVDPAHPHSELSLASRGAVFSSWSKACRKAGIVGCIASMDPMYEVFYQAWTRDGVTGLVSPQEYAQWDTAEWPDPKW